VVRKRHVFRGTIQGVGFRPALYRLASSLGLSGFVQNRRSEVVAEVQGDEGAVARFALLLPGALPPAARVDAMTSTDVPVIAADPPFRIGESAEDTFAFPPISPDLPLCADCARELLNPSNRRYLYPFITCTQCGPRYSIVERTPFDRVNTSMAPFRQCAACMAEFVDPSDRRFHSQTNSCAQCGPRLACVDSAGRPLGPREPLLAAVVSLQQGLIVAVQGIGGFHVAADPRMPGAIAKLRREKERERKPFALMVRDLEEARALCTLTPEEEKLLRSPQAPIVIARRKADAPAWLRDVSDTGTLGIMLPYTPLHLLLFLLPGVDISYRHLVMTSGNRANEPIIADPTDALRDLAGFVDVFLSHDRRIAFRTDDSIVRSGSSSPPYLLRRSRGHVPRLIPLASGVRGIVLGLGGDLKSAPSLARGRDVHLCPYNGDLDDAVTFSQFELTVRQVLQLYEARPDVVVHDLHPGYNSSRWAATLGTRTVPVQHHFAHALSVMAEHGLEESLALSFDGTGYGSDDTIWGGEFLRVTRGGFQRLGSFAPFALPGGDAAVLHPPRIAWALLDGIVESVPGLDAPSASLLSAMIKKGVNCPITTSLGRIFDAAAALLGLVDRTTYEGEGPIRLEGIGLRAFQADASLPSEAEVDRLVPALPPPGDGRLFLLDPRPLLAHLLSRRASEDAAALALFFHQAVSLASLVGARQMRHTTGLRQVVLSGGVFQNLLLRELLVPLLIKDGFAVFLNEVAPPGDGGLSVGQVWFQER